MCLDQACLKYVEDLEELEDNTTSELLSLSASLVASQIVSHKQREVPLLSACILVCVVKLFIEDGLPFSEEQSKVCQCVVILFVYCCLLFSEHFLAVHFTIKRSRKSFQFSFQLGIYIARGTPAVNLVTCSVCHLCMCVFLFRI